MKLANASSNYYLSSHWWFTGGRSPAYHETGYLQGSAPLMPPLKRSMSLLKQRLTTRKSISNNSSHPARLICGQCTDGHGRTYGHRPRRLTSGHSLFVFFTFALLASIPGHLVLKPFDLHLGTCFLFEAGARRWIWPDVGTAMVIVLAVGDVHLG